MTGQTTRHCSCVSFRSRLTQWTPYTRDSLLLALLYLDRITRLVSEPGEGESWEQSPQSLLPQFAPATSVSHEFSSFVAGSARSSISIPVPDAGTTPYLPLVTTIPPVPLLNSYTFHRLLLAALLVSAKFIADAHIATSRASKVGGVEGRELVRLEVEVLKLLKWSLRFDLQDVEKIATCVLMAGEVGEDLTRAVERPKESYVATNKDTIWSTPSSSIPPSPTSTSTRSLSTSSSSSTATEEDEEEEEEEDDDEDQREEGHSDQEPVRSQGETTEARNTSDELSLHEQLSRETLRKLDNIAILA